MRKIFHSLLLIVTLAALAAGCGSSGSDGSSLDYHPKAVVIGQPDGAFSETVDSQVRAQEEDVSDPARYPCLVYPEKILNLTGDERLILLQIFENGKPVVLISPTSELMDALFEVLELPAMVGNLDYSVVEWFGLQNNPHGMTFTSFGYKPRPEVEMQTYLGEIDLETKEITETCTNSTVETEDTEAFRSYRAQALMKWMSLDERRDAKKAMPKAAGDDLKSLASGSSETVYFYSDTFENGNQDEYAITLNSYACTSISTGKRYFLVEVDARMDSEPGYSSYSNLFTSANYGFPSYYRFKFTPKNLSPDASVIKNIPASTSDSVTISESFDYDLKGGGMYLIDTETGQETSESEQLGIGSDVEFGCYEVCVDNQYGGSGSTMTWKFEMPDLIVDSPTPGINIRQPCQYQTGMFNPQMSWIWEVDEQASYGGQVGFELVTYNNKEYTFKYFLGIAKTTRHMYYRDPSHTFTMPTPPSKN